MVYDLKGRTVLITAGSRGLGAVIANRFAARGSNVAITYNSNVEAANKVAQELKDKFGVRVAAYQLDGGIIADVERVVKDTITEFGGLDVVIGNAGWTKFADFGDLNALTEEEWDKCWAVNVKGQLALMQAAGETLKSNADGGSFIVTSSVAGKGPSGSSMAYSVTKAAQLHLIRCLAQTQGPKIRVNAVLPGLLLTEWGTLYSPDRIEALKQRAVLKDVTDIGDCADVYVSIAQNASMTGQHIAVDAGLIV